VLKPAKSSALPVDSIATHSSGDDSLGRHLDIGRGVHFDERVSATLDIRVRMCSIPTYTDT